ncbi:MAG: aspartate-alanine antiporter, partial [Gammaproteobacteria bacterium]
AVAYAITYLFGTIGMIVFVGTVAPRLLGIDIRQSARELEAELAGGDAPPPADHVSPYTRLVVRAVRVTPQAQIAGWTIALIEERFNGVSVERVMRGDRIVERDPAPEIEAGDILGVAARRDSVTLLHDTFGTEVPFTDKRYTISAK